MKFGMKSLNRIQDLPGSLSECKKSSLDVNFLGTQAKTQDPIEGSSSKLYRWDAKDFSTSFPDSKTMQRQGKELIVSHEGNTLAKNPDNAGLVCGTREKKRGNKSTKKPLQ